jgi:hypothetical protein
LRRITRRLGCTPDGAGCQRAFVLPSWHSGQQAPGDIQQRKLSARKNLIPENVDGYWLEPDQQDRDRIDPYSINFELFFVPLFGEAEMADVG